MDVIRTHRVLQGLLVAATAVVFAACGSSSHSPTHNSTSGKTSINGHLMTDLTDDSPKALKEGVLAFQLHGGFTMDIQFKDVKLKLLEEKKE